MAYDLKGKRVWGAGQCGIVGGVLVLVCLIIAEVVLRIAGAGDFPLYLASADYGYIPAPSQKGRLLHNDWAFNALSMGVAREFDPAGGGVLLIGDSIVLCGNPCRQEERLGPLVEAKIGRSVWPIGAGSWGLYNELRYMELHPEVISSVQTIVLIINPDDFEGASIWRSAVTHPTARPWSVLWYWTNKTLLGFETWRQLAATDPGPGEITLSNATLREIWSRVTTPIAGRMLVVLYPNREAMNDVVFWERTKTTALSIMAGGSARFVDIRPQWSTDYIADSIHPTVSRGIHALADIVAQEIRENK